MTRKAMNYLAKRLRDEGELPRSLRQVKAEFRKSGKILSPYERKTDVTPAITPVEYGGLQQAYDHFNKELFDGALPDVFITYQRKAHSAGYFAPDRFSARGE